MIVLYSVKWQYCHTTYGEDKCSEKILESKTRGVPEDETLKLQINICIPFKDYHIVIINAVCAC